VAAIIANLAASATFDRFPAKSFPAVFSLSNAPAHWFGTCKIPCSRVNVRRLMRHLKPNLTYTSKDHRL